VLKERKDGCKESVALGMGWDGWIGWIDEWTLRVRGVVVIVHLYLVYMSFVFHFFAFNTF
jgi:hypothetical protein